MQVRRWVWAVVLAGCAAKGRPGGPDAARPTEAQEESADPALWAVADAVDPGPQKPLFDVLPGWLRTKVGAPPDRTVAVREIREALLAWDKLRPSGGNELMMALLSVGRGLILAEQAVAGGVDDPELLLALSRAYSILSNPAFSSEQGVFQQILQFMAMAATQVKDPSAEVLEAGTVMTALREVFRRAPLLHRRTAAELLRRHGEHPEVPRVLGRLADDEINQGRFHGALQLRKLALARLGEAARGGDHIDLAMACYKALDPDCGDQARARARALGSDKPDDKKTEAGFKARLERATEHATQARRVQVLTADPRVNDAKHADLAPALERGHLLILLGHYDDARAQYEALRAAHPGDARPLAGLAKVTVTQGVNLTGAAAWVEAGRKLANRDRDFYEVALGVFGAKLVTEVVPQIMKGDESLKPETVMRPLLDDMREYATGLQAFDPARAGVMLELEAVMRAALPLLDKKDGALGEKVTRDLAERTQVLARQFPESPDVRRMMFLAATMVNDRATSLALARAPLAGKLAEDEAMQRARVQSWIDVAILWDAGEEVPGLIAAVDALPVHEGDWHRLVLVGLTRALKFKTTRDVDAGRMAATMFQVVVLDGEAGLEARMAALNNVATLNAWMGDAEEAKRVYEQVLTGDPKSMPALVNIAALYTTHGVHEPKLAEIFEVAAKDGDNTTLRLQAQAWRYTQAKAGLGDVEVTRQGFLEKMAATRTGDTRGTTAIGSLGVYTKGSWNMSLQYQATVGFTIINTMNTTSYLFLASPDTDELVAAAAAEKAKKKPGKKSARKPAP